MSISEKKKTSTALEKNKTSAESGKQKKSPDFKSPKKDMTPNKIAMRKNKFAVNKPKGSFNADAKPTEKQDWNKFKQEKKELKLKRKRTRDTYDVIVEVKKIYEEAKCNRAQNKSELVEKMYKLLNDGDNIAKVAKAHDTARVLQCMIKNATPTLRAELCDKLMPHAVDMCQSKYSHFCVHRMLKYGTSATKSKLADCVMGHVVRLAGHNIASKLLDEIYLSATTKQRCYMRQEFYGDLYKASKDDNVQTLKDAYKDADNMKASIMSAVKANIDHIANKQLVDNSLVHAVILEYFREIDSEKMEESVSALAPLIPHLLTTKEGVISSCLCFENSTPKNRRAILKAIKEHLVKIALHEQGHVFLMTLLNSLDDTKATKKSIYDPLHEHLKTLAANPNGRAVLLWLIAPADTACFHPGLIQSLDKSLISSKKEKSVRRKEILEQIEGPIANTITEDAAFWLSNSTIGLVTAAILKHITGEHYDKTAAALAPVVTQSDWRLTEFPADGDAKKPQDTENIIAEATEKRKKKQKKAIVEPPVESNNEKSDDDEEGPQPVKKSKLEKVETKQLPLQSNQIGIEDAGMHIVLKKIIKNDLTREGTPFGVKLLENLSEEVLKSWLVINRACFVLITLVENSPDLKKTLLVYFESKDMRKVLQSQVSPGAKMLAKKLDISQ
ncbi:protein penguin [Drosophila innubila]|uniref:protein penguin n=1 Tax=Drosophila innubila TaxID=198719 RepID=UPI00148C17EB|nr:protein penguin [Drosophila innubila]